MKKSKEKKGVTEEASAPFAPEEASPASQKASAVPPKGMLQKKRVTEEAAISSAPEDRKSNPIASVVPPQGWLHMDVVDKERMEWMTDVFPTPPKLELDKTETRFSLDGLVILRSVDLPSHLGLHHHGDEPQVRFERVESRVSLKGLLYDVT